MNLNNKIPDWVNNVKIIVLFIIFLSNCSFSQQANNIYPRYNITQSIGAGFKEHELAFYLSVSRSVNKNFYLGIKGGVYNFSENTVNKIIDTFITPIYPQLNIGRYEIYINNLTIQGTTYVGSFYAGFSGYKNYLLYASVGIKIHKESDYSLRVLFDKYTQNEPVPKPEYLYFNDLKPTETRTVIKPYFSIGADYCLGFINLGIYADNIYSAGLNIGVSF